MTRTTTCLFTLAAALLCAPASNAATFETDLAGFGTGTTVVPLDDQTLTLSGLPNTYDGNGPGIIEVRLRGDFFQSTEFVNITAEPGESFAWDFGRVLNDVPGDDQFNFGVGGNDVGADETLLTGTATIPKADLLQMLADNSISFLFDFSEDVQNSSDVPDMDEYIYVSLTLPDPGSVVAPEPSTFALGGLAAIGLMLFGYRRHRTARAAA